MEEEKLVRLPVECLVRGRYQPRKTFDEKKLNELAATIKSQGIIQPIVVRPLNLTQYEIIAGERRWQAAQIAGLKDIPVVIKHYSDEEALEAALVENLTREELNPIDEAEAIVRLIKEFNLTQEETAKRIGKDRSELSNKIRLLELEQRVQTLVKNDKLNATHGRILASLPLEKQFYYAEKTITKNWSTRQLEKAIKLYEPGAKKLNTTQIATKDTDTLKLEQSLADYFGQKVEIEALPNKNGSLRIHFNNFDELNGILERTGFMKND